MVDYKKIVLSLYDFTGEAVRPWARGGYTCICFDIQHSGVSLKGERFFGGGSINYIRANLHDHGVLSEISLEYRDQVTFLMAFPVCTDLAVSGAPHFENKRAADPLFQEKAADHARWCARLADTLDCPYLIENPVSALSSHWRKPDYIFNPYEYGGYIPEDEADHPTWPEYIAPRDAYPKKTCLWTGGGILCLKSAQWIAQ